MTKKQRLLLRGLLPGATRPMDVLIEGPRIARITPAGRGPADFGDPEAIIGPSLFDIQVNGAAGVPLQGPLMRPENVARIHERLAGYGVSHWVPTVITASLEEMEHACRAIAEALRDRALARRIPGIHLEGPWISPDDGPRGAHPAAHTRLPKIAAFDRLTKAAEGKILYVTLAPELPGAARFIRALRARGVRVSLGHHNASMEQIAQAVDAGASLCTHLGNGAAAMIHRHRNPIWPQLADDRLAAAFIADLHHLPAPVLRAMIRAKGVERSILTSDCTPLAGMPPGGYDLFGARVELLPNGKIRLVGTDLLAGSGTMLPQGVVNAWKSGGLGLEQAFACATVIPARTLGVRLPHGMPKPGGRANLLVIKPVLLRGEWRAQVCASVIDGVAARRA